MIYKTVQFYQEGKFTLCVCDKINLVLTVVCA